MSIFSRVLKLFGYNPNYYQEALGLEDGEEMGAFVNCKIYQDATAGEQAKALLLSVVSVATGGGGVFLDGVQSFCTVTSRSDLVFGFPGGSAPWRLKSGSGYSISDQGDDNQKVMGPNAKYETGRILSLDSPQGQVCRLVVPSSQKQVLLVWKG